jgi:hypothetical protein
MVTWKTCETLIYHIWNINISDFDMSYSPESHRVHPNIHSNALLAFLQRSRIIIGTITGNVSACNVLKEALCATRDLRIRQTLLALGPTSPVSLGVRHPRVLWATFLDPSDVQNGVDPVVVAPTHLTDLSIGLDKMADRSSVRLLLGDFLDSALSASCESAVFPFLSRLLTRIRERKQTAFFLVTEDMHDTKKIAMVKRFADVVIEYRRMQGGAEHDVETRTLDYGRDCYSDWQRAGSPQREYEGRALLPQWNKEIGIRP